MKNAEIRSSNAAMGSLANMALAALGWKKMTIQNKMDAIQKEKEKIKLHLMEERPQEELMETLQFSQPEANFTSSGTMLIYVTVSSKKQWKISGVDAVIDGSFLAEIYEGDRLIGCAYLNLPRDGIVETVSMEGHCPAAKPGGDYTVVIIPNALWLIEKYTPPQISYNDAYHVREQKYCDISTHSFRKWYATEIYKANGYDIALVQRLLQHSSAAVTQRYIGIEPQRIETAIQNHAQLI